MKRPCQLKHMPTMPNKDAASSSQTHSLIKPSKHALLLHMTSFSLALCDLGEPLVRHWATTTTTCLLACMHARTSQTALACSLSLQSEVRQAMRAHDLCTKT